MPWGGAGWGVTPWGDGEAASTFPNVIVGSVQDVEVLAENLLRVNFDLEVKNNSVLLDPANYAITPLGAGDTVGILQVRSDPNDPAVTSILITITPFTIGETYDLTVSSDLKTRYGAAVTSTTAKFKGRNTKLDSMIRNRPGLYAKNDNSIAKNILVAISVEDDKIGGGRDDRF